MSLRSRLILSFTLIIFVCLFIAALVTSVLLQGYRDRTATTRLEDMTRPIFVQYRALIRGQASVTEVWTSLQEQAQRNSIYILLADNNGNIIRQVTPQEGNKQPLNIAPGGLPHGINKQTNGTLVTVGGLKFLYVAYPLPRQADATTSPARLETLVLAVPRSGAVAIWASLIGPFFWAGLITLGISVVVAIFLARSIYRPIQRFARAAENVAQGHYDQTIPETGAKELKGLAVSFNEMSTKVKESQQQLRHFVADVSHQLKSPLTSIQGFAQAMLDGTAGDSETKLKATQIIVDESKRMIRQVNELLELSRMQAGQVKMARELVDMKELLLHCQEIFALRAQEKGLHLSNKIEPLMPVTGDVDRLEDVFCNLLDNAMKNTPAQGEIRVTGRNLSNAVEIAVADSGPGIPPEQLSYVFKRFHQGTGLRSGTGLGLAIAQEIVLAHHGKIEVTSNPGEGARFVVTLPASTSIKS